MEDGAEPAPVDDSWRTVGADKGPEMQKWGHPKVTPLPQCMSGGVLLSHNLSVAVPSALKGLTSGFGMGPGVSRFAMAAVTLSTVHIRLTLIPRMLLGVLGLGVLVGNCLVDANSQDCVSCLCVFVTYALAQSHVLGVWFCTVLGQALGLLVPVGWALLLYTSGLSTPCSVGGLTHLRGGKPHLETCFPLRCIQRLSLPNVANQPCSWQNNWHTRGSSIPVLSY